MAEETGDTTQNQLLAAMEKGQDAIVEAVRQWAEAGTRMTPDLSALPISNLLPKPEELVASQFDFAEKLLANQRRFAEELLAAVRPKTS